MTTARSNADTIRDYFRRQYELEQGSVVENIHALFAEDAVYHVGNGETANRDAIIPASRTIRQTPKGERIAEVSELREEGDTVSFRMHIRWRDPETGELVERETDNVWRFNADGKVVEATPRQLDLVERMLR